MIPLHYPVAFLLFVVGFYCLLFRRNLIKIVIGLELITDGVHLFLISLGFRSAGGPPILTGDFLTSFSGFVGQAVDPIPQVLVLTSIVIDISIVAFALSLVIYLYREYGTLNPSKIKGLSG